MSDGWFTYLERGLDIPFSYPSLVVALSLPYALVFAFYLQTPTQLADADFTLLILALLILYKPIIYSFTATITHQKFSESQIQKSPLQITIPYTVFTFLSTTILILTGFIFVILPGFYLSYKLTYAIPFSAIYGDRPLQSISSSYTKTHESSDAIYRLLTLTVIFILCFIIAFSATTLLGLSYYLLGMIIGVLFTILASLIELGIISAMSILAIQSRETNK